MIWPLDSNITQGFSLYHPGLDFAGSVGDPVRCPVSGVVVQTGYDPIGGYFVVVGERYTDREHYTGHHNRILVSVGQNVDEGTIIAEVGATGAQNGPFRVTGPHVHYQIRTRYGGEFLNPYYVYELSRPTVIKLANKVEVIDMDHKKDIHQLLHETNQRVDALERSRVTKEDLTEAFMKVDQVNKELVEIKKTLNDAFNLLNETNKRLDALEKK